MRLLLVLILVSTAGLWKAVGDPPPPGSSSPAEEAPAPVAMAYDTPVVLQGRLVEMIFPGKPNYESVTHGDHADQLFFLMLDNPITVPGKPGDSPDMEPVRYAEMVQLILTDEQTKRCLGWRALFKTTTFAFSGKLHHASHGSERLQLVLWTDAVKVAKSE